MPGLRRVGMDHDLYGWSPLPSRPKLTWPNGARVAVCIIVNLEHWAWDPPTDPFVPVTFYGGVGWRPHPDIGNFSHREYGNRVGVFRVMQELDRWGLRASAAIDLAVAQHYPFLVQECARRGWEFIAHGQAVNRIISSKLTEAQERDYIMETVRGIADATGVQPRGWLGPEFGESARTPWLLHEAGLQYVCDWPNDEQPYLMRSQGNGLYALPVTLDLDDVFTMWTRNVPPARYSRMVCEAFEVLYADGGDHPRLLVWNLHPWLIGQPFRIKYLAQALAHLQGRQRVWYATGSEIIDWYAAQR